MTNSNILDIFTPSPSTPITGPDCYPCQILSAVGSSAAGIYLSTGYIFKDCDPVKNPTWWRNTVRVGGVALIGFGCYRAGQGTLWDKDHEYKPFL